MLVACARMCECANGLTKVYREESRERNANVGKRPALPVSYHLPARTQALIRVFFVWKENESSLNTRCAFNRRFFMANDQACTSVFTLIYNNIFKI